MTTHRFKYKGRLFTMESQDVKALTNHDINTIYRYYLPVFFEIWSLIEKHTGYRWKCTSWIRHSANHKHAGAFDLAPDFAPEDYRYYAVARRSDPVLYKRGILIRKLQRVVRELRGKSILGITPSIFIENDHLHIQLLTHDNPELFKWKNPKPVYPDTLQRMALPMLN